MCKQGLINIAADLFWKMKDNGCPPNGFTYNTMIRGCILNNAITNALYFCDLMVSNRFEADARTFSLMVGLLSNDNVNESLKIQQQKLINSIRSSQVCKD